MPEPVVRVAAWLLTYALHSTGLLLAAGWLAGRLRAPAHKEMLWKAALIGGLVTASFQAAGLASPVAGRLVLAPAASRSPVAWVLASEAQVTAADPGEPKAAVEAPAGATPGAADEAASTTTTLAEQARRAARIARSRAWQALRGGWWLLLTAGWAAGAALAVVRLASGVLLLRRRLSGRQSLAEGPLVDALARLRAAVGWRGEVRLSWAPGLASPLVLARAWGTAEICLPGRALRELSPPQQAHLLAHELAHVMRRDAAWLWLCAALETLLWFQPLNGLGRRAWQAQAEFMCDDWAARLAGSPRAMAECLAATAAWTVDRQSWLAVGLLARPAGLAPRVGRLLAGPRAAPAPRWAWVLAAAMLIVAALAAPGVWLPGPKAMRAAGLPALAGSRLLEAGRAWLVGEAPVIDPRLDAAGRALLPAGATDVTLSPDGQLAALRVGHFLTADLYVLDLAHGRLRALTRDQGGNIQPLWSPDGQWLAYVSHRDGSMEVYAVSAAGGAPLRVTRNWSYRHAPVWNEDGTLTVTTRGVRYWTQLFDPVSGTITQAPVN
jgi:beta-lactamase regulating signal transducer with metallopeptidase domain